MHLTISLKEYVFLELRNGCREFAIITTEKARQIQKECPQWTEICHLVPVDKGEHTYELWDAKAWRESSVRRVALVASMEQVHKKHEEKSLKLSEARKKLVKAFGETRANAMMIDLQREDPEGFWTPLKQKLGLM